MDPDALFDFSAPPTGQEPVAEASSATNVGKRAASNEPDDSLPSKSARRDENASDHQASSSEGESDEGDDAQEEQKDETTEPPASLPPDAKAALPTEKKEDAAVEAEHKHDQDLGKEGMEAEAPDNAGITVTDDFTAETIQNITNASAASGAAAGGAAPPATGDSSESTALSTGEGKAAGKVQLRHSVRHQVAVPAGVPYVPLAAHVPPSDPAKVYPFTLDPFQQTAVYCIQRNESVLVSAHTSAGKTVVAEYAIAHCLKGKQRVVYTSPIKALSNQKFRELTAEFGDVGLMTGDVTINPSASCLVMTTEILRSMLYRGSEIMREVAWVIFDEIHYMRDKDRGVVWEETIILLPRQVRYVFLSATIPNAMQFAEWIAQTHQQSCHVVYTNFRPTPLQHYLYPQSAEGIFLVVDEKGVFRDENFQRAMGALKDSHGEDPASANSGAGKRKGSSKKGKGEKEDGQSDIYKIVKMIMVKNYNPVIVFAFSKRECENLAMQMSKLEFNTDEERETVSTVFNNAISVLHPEDQELPQIKHILPLLQRGIGIHHGGLLPILKEVIEILFQEGLLKVLFATETFSIGLNMPAKTVVFTSVRKWDGTTFRNLSSGEFIQMSGRAGRRGLDDRGIVIMMFDEQLEPDDAKQMIRGQADRLDSAFHLGYNMVLNLMRVEGISPEFMLERCFYQFQQAASIPGLERERQAAEVTASAMVVPHETILGDMAGVRKQLALLEDDYTAVTTHPSYSLRFLQAGRLVKVATADQDFGWGLVVEYQKRQAPKGKEAAAEYERLQQDPRHAAEGYIVDVLLNVVPAGSKEDAVRNGKARSILGVPPPPGPPRPNAGPPMNPVSDADGGEMVVVPVLMSCIKALSGVRVNSMPRDLHNAGSRNQVRQNLAKVFKQLKDNPPRMDPVKDLKIKDEGFLTLLKKMELLRKREHELHKQLEEAVAKQSKDSKKSKKASTSSSKAITKKEVSSLEAEYAAKQDAYARAEALAGKLAAARNVLQLDELKSRKRVLRRLGFVSEADVVMQKGRVACEISTGDELLLTELIFSGVFNTLDPASCAALASTFVFSEKSETPAQIPEALVQPLQALQDTARRIARVARESRLDIKEDDYVRSFRVELIQPVLLWCSGKNFAEMLKLTDVFEGTIIRTFRRLQELLRQLVDAAKAIGSEELEHRFKSALELLERPNSIIFSPSLYL